MNHPVRAIFDGLGQRVAVMGLAKNTGKTTTLRWLLAHTADTSANGLLSIGIDGEETDYVGGHEKPRISIREGTLVLSTTDALSASSAAFEYLESLSWRTALGEAVIARAQEEGTVILAGIRHRRDLIQGVERLIALGADRVWIDGAYGRSIGAHPLVSDSLILSTGAIIGSDIDEVVDRTFDRAKRFLLPRATKDSQDLLTRATTRRQILFHSATGETMWAPRGAAFTAFELQAPEASPGMKIVIPGLVSNRVARALLSYGNDCELIVCDPTCLQYDSALGKRLEMQYQMSVGARPELVAISVNPTSVYGVQMNRNELVEKLSTVLPEITVFEALPVIS